MTAQPGEAAFLVADAEAHGTVSGERVCVELDPVNYLVPTVAVIYVSGCGYTEHMAEKIADGIRDCGGLDTCLIDLASESQKSAAEKICNAAGVLFGTPTIHGEAPERIWSFLTGEFRGCIENKYGSAFGWFTWNGAGIRNIIERLRQLGMNLADGGFSAQYAQDDANNRSSYEYGFDFACRLLDKPNTHRSALVKCLVCGEIFDSSLGVCPVCGVGMDKCVPVEDEVIGHAENTDRTYVIAGGGVAALSAAEAIRKRDVTGRIILISNEDELPINRPALLKNMSVVVHDTDSIILHGPDWFSENRIEILLRTTVSSLNPAEKAVVLSDGSVLLYDKFIYALGSECFVPPIPGSQLDGIVTVRHLPDVQKILRLTKGTRKAVIIGGGVLGLEAACEMKKRHMEVTVLEMMPVLMPRQLDEETGRRLIEAGDKYGVKIMTGVQISELVGEERVRAVRLADGVELPADIVIISAGVRPTIGIAQKAGVQCERAVLVNANMETNLSDVLACGDCAVFGGVNYQLWGEAAEQGRIAGANAAGDRLQYKPVPYGVDFHGFNCGGLFAIGDVGKGGGNYRMVEFRDEFEGSYRKYWFDGNRLCGGILFGSTEKVQTLSDSLARKKTYLECRNEL